MGVVGSLPSPPPPPPPSTSNDTSKISCEESTSSSDECNYSIFRIDDIDSNTNSSLNSNIDNQDKSNSCKNVKRKDPSAVTYGPINIKVRKSTALTLETGRRSKFMQLEGRAAERRELRRKRNREAAQRLKEKRIHIEQQLEKDIRELEFKEHDLLSKVRNLEIYKEQLESQYQYIIAIQEKLTQTTSSTLKYIEYNHQRFHQNVTAHQSDTHIKEEPDPPSPQWQLLFSI